MQKFKVNGQLVLKLEWKQTDGRTDGRTETIALLATLMRSEIMCSELRAAAAGDGAPPGGSDEN